MWRRVKIYKTFKHSTPHNQSEWLSGPRWSPYGAKLACLNTMDTCFHLNFLLASLTHSSKAHAIHRNKVIEIKICFFKWERFLRVRTSFKSFSTQYAMRASYYISDNAVL